MNQKLHHYTLLVHNNYLNDSDLRRVRITADYSTAKITQHCLVVVDREDESKTESIEQYAVTTSKFSMC